MTSKSSLLSTSSHSLRSVWPEILVGVVGAAIFGCAALTTISWYDSGEFGAVAWRLSISHAPGHPLHAITTHLSELLPFGDLAFRANLSSAIALVASGVFWCHFFLDIQKRDATPKLGQGLIAVFCALFYLLLPAIFVQGIRAEVYALQNLLNAAILCVAWKYFESRDRRLWVCLGFLFGLAGANHTFVAVSLLPVALVAMIAAWPGIKSVIFSIISGIFGLCLYAYLPIRATHGGEIGFGAPQTLREVLWHISGFEWLAEKAHLSQPGDLGFYLFSQFGVVVSAILMVLIAIALIRAVHEIRQSKIAAVVGVSICVVLLVSILNRQRIDELNPDIGGYMAPALAALVTLACVGANTIYETIQNHSRIFSLAAPALIAVCVALAVPRVDPGNRLESTTADRFARALFAEAPMEGGLVFSDYQSYFTTQALRAFEGTRPDVALVFRGRRNEPWHKARLMTQSPKYAQALTDYPTRLVNLPTHFEPGVLPTAAEYDLLKRMRPHGLTFRPFKQPAEPDEVKARFQALGITKESDIDARKAMAFLHLQHATHHREFAQFKEEKHLAGWHLEQALLLAPGDPELLEEQEQFKKAPNIDGTF